MEERWFKEAVIYSLEVNAFQDSNGDGVGDIRGLIARLDYLSRLGVTCLWLNPVHPTPNRDDGYDVTDFYGIDRRLGSLGDFVELVPTCRAAWCFLEHRTLHGAMARRQAHGIISDSMILSPTLTGRTLRYGPRLTGSWASGCKSASVASEWTQHHSSLKTSTLTSQRLDGSTNGCRICELA
jgi:hypothetical protein